MRPNMTKKTSIAAVAVMAALALPMVAGAANKLVVRNAGDTADAAVVTDTGFIGLNTSSPLGPLHLVSQGSNIPSAAVTMEHTALTVAPGQAIAPNLSMYRNNLSTVGNNGLPRNGDWLGYLNFGAITDSSTTPPTKYNSAQIAIAAEGNWSATANASNIKFFTTGLVSGVNSYSEKMRIASNGNVSIGTGLGATQKLEVNGGIRFNPVAVGAVPAPTKPACSSTTRGTMWYTPGAAGVKDSFEVCAKDAADAYQWRTLY